MEDQTTKLRRDARAIWDTGLTAVHPERLVEKALRIEDGGLVCGGLELPREFINSVTIVGAGKAAAGMARGVASVLKAGFGDDLPIQGWVNVPAALAEPLGPIHLHPARDSHDNVPTPAALDGSRRILKTAEVMGKRDLMIAVLSGGASALLAAPAAGISVEDKAQVSRLLHERGATIEEVNAVRKHLSDIKGGGLAKRFRGGWLLSLILSDVVGDPLDVIASGPTTVDESSFEDALSVLEACELVDDPEFPASVLDHLKRGAAGELPETLRALPPQVTNTLIGNNAMALEAAEDIARALGYQVLNLSSYQQGETEACAGFVAGLVRGIQNEQRPLATPACILLGGETTVDLRIQDGRAPGKGGRNQHFVLSLMAELGWRDLDAVVALSGGTDGEDGPTDAAGGFVDQGVLAKGQELGLDLLDHIEGHDAYSYLDATGGLIRTGLTGTNVMDLRVILVGAARD